MTLRPLPFGAPSGIPVAMNAAPKQRRFKVRGKNATSYEFYVSAALDAVGLDYLFQASYFGGRRVRGGVVVDFIVFTRPLPTPVWVNGEYWHKGKQASIDYYQGIILSQFGPGFFPPVVFFGEQASTPEAAMQSVRKAFMV